ncbi:type II toxin-antitoxin system Phd/YefM family antitoxin [Proteiniborus sp. MB09-C3]|uniref:type II toxin-antitoxin system Phd/YefM family antitoxin n=1 Tax=Proteiniborus sp. MB09-C3 TaxID=3050072 RepID=UPI0025577107|nr:type II toxin-antitoxin system Phd/YefM family antitoxin [Proteiniborus sp. MB09-C3]WIV12906.1 type II toxin-antitoxin system Phd/YefM family antitoxin [Proteiniborus sp. MB09-C3]
MNININNLVSISEANQNSSKIARMVDENGVAVILKNNKPRYVLIEYRQLEKEKIVGEMKIDEVAKKILSKHMRAFEELAKLKGFVKNKL